MAKHRDIFETFYRRITAGELAPGDRLPTEKEIGETFGVSRITVTRAMSNLESRGLIRRVAGKGTYVALPAETTNDAPFFLLLPGLRDKFYHDTTRAFHRFFREKEALSVSLMPGYDIAPVRQALAWAATVGTRGVAVMASQLRDKRAALAETLREYAFPIVNGLRYLEDFAGRQVIVDDAFASRVAVDHLVAMGHRSIVFVGPSSKDRYQGFLRALAVHGIAAEGCPSVERADIISVPRFRELFDVEKRPTAIVAADERYALGVYDILKSLGLRVPADVAMVSLYGGSMASAVETPLTTVDWPGKEFGAALAETLWKCSRDEAPESDITLCPILKIRESCGASPGKYRHEYLRGLLEEYYE